MELLAIPIEKPEDTNFILGQSHFIKTVEDLHEAIYGAVPGIRFGVAFCEASGKRLVRTSGTDDAALELATKNAQNIGAGHSFIVVLGDGFFPVNVLNAVKMVPEVCRIFCATPIRRRCWWRKRIRGAGSSVWWMGCRRLASSVPRMCSGARIC